MNRKLYSTAPYNDPLIGTNTMSQKVVMDRRYYNQFYKFSDSNAKLLRIRKQSRLTNSGGGIASNFENSCSFLQATTTTPGGLIRTLANDSSNGSNSKIGRIFA